MKPAPKLDLMQIGAMSAIGGPVVGFTMHMGAAGLGGLIGGCCLMGYAYFKRRTPNA